MSPIGPLSDSGASPSAAGQLRADSWSRVRMNPGHRTETLTGDPVIASSSASASDSPTTACLVAVYGLMNGNAFSPATDAVLTTWPSCCSTSRGTNARIPLTTPQRLTPKAQSQPDCGISHVSPPPPPTPALLHTTCAVPKFV